MALMGISEAEARAMFRSMFAIEIAEPKAEIRKLKEQNEKLSEKLIEWQKKYYDLDQIVEKQMNFLLEARTQIAQEMKNREKEQIRIVSEHLNKTSQSIDKEMNSLNELAERNSANMHKNVTEALESIGESEEKFYRSAENNTQIVKDAVEHIYKSAESTTIEMKNELAKVLKESSLRHTEVIESALSNFDKEVGTLSEKAARKETELCATLEKGLNAFQREQDAQDVLLNSHTETLNLLREQLSRGERESGKKTEEDERLDASLDELNLYIQGLCNNIGELQISLEGCDKRIGSLEVLSRALPQRD